jgi:hypothetical protein
MSVHQFYALSSVLKILEAEREIINRIVDSRDMKNKSGAKKQIQRK